MSAPPYVHEHAQGVVLELYVQPNARHSAIAGEYDRRLKITLARPPVAGKANAELCKFLASTFAIGKSQVNIQHGHRGRRKRVLLQHAGTTDVSSAITKFLRGKD